MAAICAAIALSAARRQARLRRRCEVVPPPSRDVTPPGITPAPQGDGPLIREAVPPPPPEPPRWRRFFLPKTLDAGTFGVKAMAIRISGVDPPPRDATCTARRRRVMAVRAQRAPCLPHVPPRPRGRVLLPLCAATSPR